MENVLQVAIDAVNGKVTKYATAAETSDALRNAMIEMNGGSTKLNPKTFYRGAPLYTLVEELLPVAIDAGLRADNELMKLVDYRNTANGDQNEFRTQGAANFIVSDVAAGIQGLRRQRMPDGSTVSVTTTPKGIRVYENLGRLLAGRADFNEFINGVATSFQKQVRQDAYDCIAAIANTTTGLSSTYVISGSYSEATMLTLIEHVEAATGKTAQIVGTKTGLRKLVPGTVADSAKEDLYNVGFYGKFNGTPMIAMKQAHKADGSTFVLSDTRLYVIATDEKPIKLVNEGSGILATKDAIANADLTQEYVYILPYGVGAIFADKMGINTISG